MADTRLTWWWLSWNILSLLMWEEKQIIRNNTQLALPTVFWVLWRYFFAKLKCAKNLAAHRFGVGGREKYTFFHEWQKCVYLIINSSLASKIKERSSAEVKENRTVQYFYYYFISTKSEPLFTNSGKFFSIFTWNGKVWRHFRKFFISNPSLPEPVFVEYTYFDYTTIPLSYHQFAYGDKKTGATLNLL